jgi:ABC-type lipoprotein release transport system permease subunit
MGPGFLFETFRMSLHALAANRLRSLLALLGIVIGVATVIGMVALVNGFQRSV